MLLDILVLWGTVVLTQPANSVCLISFIEKMRECFNECCLPAFDHAAVDLQFLCGLSDRQSFGKACIEDLDVVREYGFQRLMQEGNVLAHGEIIFFAETPIYCRRSLISLRRLRSKR